MRGVSPLSCLCCWGASGYTDVPKDAPDGIYKPPGNKKNSSNRKTLDSSTKTAVATPLPSSNDACWDSDTGNPLVDNTRVLRLVWSFSSAEAFLFIAGVSRHWRHAWGGTNNGSFHEDNGSNSGRPRATVTSLYSAVQSTSCLAWSKDSGLPWNEKTAAYAAALGGLEQIKYARSQGCPWDEMTCSMVASTGQLELLRWLRDNGCPWDKYTCAAAAGAGYLKLVKWCRANDCPWSRSTCEWAAGGGPIEKPVRWWTINHDIGKGGADNSTGGEMESSRSGAGWERGVEDKAVAKFDWFAVVAKTHQQRVRNQMRNLMVLKWCRRNACPWDKKTCVSAAQKGHLKVLQWCRGHGCPWNKDVCDAAAMGGHLDVLWWCRANGCEWSDATCVAAAYGGNLRLLKWCKDNGCPWQAEAICQYAAWKGHLEILQWCVMKGCKWSKVMCEGAARGGHLEVLKWCRANGCPWDEMTIAWAAYARQAEILEYCKANGCPTGEFAKECILAIEQGTLSDASIMTIMFSGNATWFREKASRSGADD